MPCAMESRQATTNRRAAPKLMRGAIYARAERIVSIRLNSDVMLDVRTGKQNFPIWLQIRLIRAAAS